MNTFFSYAYIHPITGEIIDRYKELAQKYKDSNKWIEYWNSLLRILLRKYGLPFNSLLHKVIHLLDSQHNPDSQIAKNYTTTSYFSVFVSRWFRKSRVFEEIINQSNDEISANFKKELLHEHLTNLLKEIKTLEMERRKLCMDNNIPSIPLIIKTVGGYPSIGKEIWKSGQLIEGNNTVIKFDLENTQSASFIEFIN